MNTLSIICICQDEEELLPEFFESCINTYERLGEDFKEVVIVDGGSKDSSVDIIKWYQKATTMPIILIEHPFDTFGQQKNRAIEKTTGDYVFGPDADMTWTNNFVDWLKQGHFIHSPMWDFILYFTVRDKFHYFKNWPLGPNMRLWRNGLKFVSNFHEKLEGQIPGLPVVPGVYIFENSCRQSDRALLNRGERYQKFVAQMTQAGMGPGDSKRYFDAAHVPDSEVDELPASILKLIN